MEYCEYRDIDILVSSNECTSLCISALNVTAKGDLEIATQFRSCYRKILGNVSVCSFRLSGIPQQRGPVLACFFFFFFFRLDFSRARARGASSLSRGVSLKSGRGGAGRGGGGRPSRGRFSARFLNDSRLRTIRRENGNGRRRNVDTVAGTARRGPLR